MVEAAAVVAAEVGGASVDVAAVGGSVVDEGMVDEGTFGGSAVLVKILGGRTLVRNPSRS